MLGSNNFYNYADIAGGGPASSSAGAAMQTPIAIVPNSSPVIFDPLYPYPYVPPPTTAAAAAAAAYPYPYPHPYPYTDTHAYAYPSYPYPYVPSSLFPTNSLPSPSVSTSPPFWYEWQPPAAAAHSEHQSRYLHIRSETYANAFLNNYRAQTSEQQQKYFPRSVQKNSKSGVKCTLYAVTMSTPQTQTQSQSRAHAATSTATSTAATTPETTSAAASAAPPVVVFAGVEAGTAAVMVEAVPMSQPRSRIQHPDQNADHRHHQHHRQRDHHTTAHTNTNSNSNVSESHNRREIGDGVQNHSSNRNNISISWLSSHSQGTGTGTGRGRGRGRGRGTVAQAQPEVDQAQEEQRKQPQKSSSHNKIRINLKNDITYHNNNNNAEQQYHYHRSTKWKRKQMRTGTVPRSHTSNQAIKSDDKNSNSCGSAATTPLPPAFADNESEEKEAKAGVAAAPVNGKQKQKQKQKQKHQQTIVTEIVYNPHKIKLLILKQQQQQQQQQKKDCLYYHVNSRNNGYYYVHKNISDNGDHNDQPKKPKYLENMITKIFDAKSVTYVKGGKKSKDSTALLSDQKYTGIDWCSRSQPSPHKNGGRLRRNGTGDNNGHRIEILDENAKQDIKRLRHRLHEFDDVFEKLEFDLTSIYSITQTDIANATADIIKFVYEALTASTDEVTNTQKNNRVTISDQSADQSNRNTIYILDGMACVGLGNIYSFAKIFSESGHFLFANEYDAARYHMLTNNLQLLSDHNLLMKSNSNSIQCWNCDVTALHLDPSFAQFRPKINIVFLDPEWGGNDYKTHRKLKLRIADYAVEDVIANVFNLWYKNCKIVACKLPLNYDFAFLKFKIDSNTFGDVSFLKTQFANQALLLVIKTANIDPHFRAKVLTAVNTFQHCTLE